MPAVQPSLLPRRLSPAAIDRYRGCPRTAYLQFVAHVTPEHVVTPARTVGNAIHDALDGFFAAEPAVRTEGMLHSQLRTAWRRQPRDRAFASRAEEHFYGRQALQQLSTFVEHFDTAVRPFARERWMQAPLPNGSVVYGKIDRLDVLSAAAGMNGPCLDVVDYKSGQHALEDADLPTDSASQTYLLATEHQTKAPVRRVRYLYLATGQEARWEVEREDVDSARQRLDRLTRRMHTDREFEARPGKRCTLCPFVAACEAHRQAVGRCGPG